MTNAEDQADTAEDRPGLAGAGQVSEEEITWMSNARSTAQRLGVIAAFAIGVGLILVGTGNGIWRLIALGDLGDPQGVFAFVFHLATAATLVVLGASLLPLSLNLLSGEEPVSLRQPATLFALLWLIVGLFGLFSLEAPASEAIGGSIVLMLAGIFGLLAVGFYEPEQTGSSLTAGVMGLVGAGLLIGGVAAVPGSITNASRFGSELVFRYGEAVHVAGYLVAILAAAVFPFVKANPRGHAGVVLGASLGGIVWGLGELVFAVWWLSAAPWSLFGQLGAGASAGYAFVLAGGLATVLGGLALLGASAALAGYAGTPLAANLRSPAGEEAPDPAGAADKRCAACGASVTTAQEACPACGTEPLRPA